MPKKYSYFEIKDYFEKNQCSLLTTENEYTGTRQKLKFKCSCGQIGIKSFHKFKVTKSEKCQQCKPSNLNFEQIKIYFENENCKILDNQVKSLIPINYICQCGKIAKTRLNKFKSGVRCDECNNKKRSNSAKLMWKKEDIIQKHLGKNNGKWNSKLTDEERKHYRKNYKECKEYRDWRINVYKKDNFTCQVCFKTKKFLNAHHLYNYADYKDLRFDLNNGITLCKECHINFHIQFGYGKNTNEQFKIYQEGINV